MRKAPIPYAVHIPAAQRGCHDQSGAAARSGVDTQSAVLLVAASSVAMVYSEPSVLDSVLKSSVKSIIYVRATVKREAL